MKILGDSYRISVYKVLKNNDIELDALTIVREDSCLSPTIYLNQYFTEYEEGRQIEEIIKDILKLYNEHKEKMELDIDYFKDFNRIKHRIAFKIINARQNEKLLKEIPYVSLLDLAIVFYCLIGNNQIGSATALIHQSHLAVWDIDVSELYKVALKNTPEILDYELRNMNDILKEMLINELTSNKNVADRMCDMSLEKDEIEELALEMIKHMQGARNNIQMFVLTNKQKINGAACMLYTGVLKGFALSVDKDIYILPSSIHEVILVPAASGISEEQLNCMIKEVNREEVEDGDVLSDHIYIYRKDTDQIYM